MSVTRVAPNTAMHFGDRDFFLLVLAVIWFGNIAGFVPDILEHITGAHVPFAAIVHVHAVFYVGWLVLLTTQMILIRSRRVNLHRGLGLIAVIMIPAMVVLGPWTGLVMGRREFGTPDGDPQLLSVIFLDALNFGVIATGGLLARKNAFVHRRLMLIATVFISGAGFSRWLAGPVAKLLGAGIIPYYVESYLPTLIVCIAIVTYDLCTRRRLNTTVIAAIAFGVLNNWIACVLHELPAWKTIADHLLGH